MGTSGDKAVLVDINGKIHGSVFGAYGLHHPHPNWAEQDADEWWSVICNTTKQVLKHTGVAPDKIAGMVFSCMMATTLPIDENGKPLRPAIIWLDTRSDEQARKLMNGMVKIQGYGLGRLLTFLKLTGGAPSLAGKDCISKIMWVREKEPEIAKRTFKFLDGRDYLLYRCTDDFVTSRDCASLTWMMDTREGKMDWSPKILDMLGLDRAYLPEIKCSTDVVGEVTKKAAGELGIPAGTPVINGCGDVAAALIGSGAVLENQVHTYIGTSGWVVAPVTKRLISISDYIGSLCSADPDKYMCVAEQEVSGAAYQWFKNELGEGQEFKTLDAIAAKVPAGSENVIFTPWMFGERSPIDDHYVRGSFFNLSLETKRANLVRAVMEGVAYHIHWMLEGVEKLLATRKATVDWINIIGGGATSDIWCQIVADVTEKKIRRVADPLERVSVGAALTACVGLGYDKCCDDLCHKVRIEKEFKPNPSHQQTYGKLFQTFKNYYKQTAKLYRDLNG